MQIIYYASSSSTALAFLYKFTFAKCNISFISLKITMHHSEIEISFICYAVQCTVSYHRDMPHDVQCSQNSWKLAEPNNTIPKYSADNN